MLTFYVPKSNKAQSFTFFKKKKSNLISFTLGHDVAELREEKKSWNIQYAHIADFCTDCPTKAVQLCNK